MHALQNQLVIKIRYQPQEGQPLEKKFPYESGNHMESVKLGDIYEYVNKFLDLYKQIKQCVIVTNHKQFCTQLIDRGFIVQKEQNHNLIEIVLKPIEVRRKLIDQIQKIDNRLPTLGGSTQTGQNSRLMNQPNLRSKDLKIGVLYADPLYNAATDTGGKKGFLGPDPISYDHQIRKIKEQTQAKNVKVICKVATKQNLVKLLDEEEVNILHISCHGIGNYLYIQSEKDFAYLDILTGKYLAQRIMASRARSKDTLKCVLLMACHSQPIAQILHKQLTGEYKIPLIVAIKADYEIENMATEVFSQKFYNCMMHNGTYQDCFTSAVKQVQKHYQHCCCTHKYTNQQMHHSQERIDCRKYHDKVTDEHIFKCVCKDYQDKPRELIQNNHHELCKKHNQQITLKLFGIAWISRAQNPKRWALCCCRASHSESTKFCQWGLPTNQTGEQTVHKQIIHKVSDRHSTNFQNNPLKLQSTNLIYTETKYPLRNYYTHCELLYNAVSTIYKSTAQKHLGIIVGRKGIGKSSLARKIYTYLQNRPKEDIPSTYSGCFYINVEKFYSWINLCTSSVYTEMMAEEVRQNINFSKPMFVVLDHVNQFAVNYQQRFDKLIKELCSPHLLPNHSVILLVVEQGGLLQYDYRKRISNTIYNTQNQIHIEGVDIVVGMRILCDFNKCSFKSQKDRLSMSEEFPKWLKWNKLSISDIQQFKPQGNTLLDSNKTRQVFTDDMRRRERRQQQQAQILEKAAKFYSDKLALKTEKQMFIMLALFSDELMGYQNCLLSYLRQCPDFQGTDFQGSFEYIRSIMMLDTTEQGDRTRMPPKIDSEFLEIQKRIIQQSEERNRDYQRDRLANFWREFVLNYQYADQQLPYAFLHFLNYCEYILAHTMHIFEKYQQQPFTISPFTKLIEPRNHNLPQLQVHHIQIHVMLSSIPKSLGLLYSKKNFKLLDCQKFGQVLVTSLYIIQLQTEFNVEATLRAGDKIYSALFSIELMRKSNQKQKNWKLKYSEVLCDLYFMLLASLNRIDEMKKCYERIKIDLDSNTVTSSRECSLPYMKLQNNYLLYKLRSSEPKADQLLSELRSSSSTIYTNMRHRKQRRQLSQRQWLRHLTNMSQLCICIFERGSEDRKHSKKDRQDINLPFLSQLQKHIEAELPPPKDQRNLSPPKDQLNLRYSLQVNYYFIKFIQYRSNRSTTCYNYDKLRSEVSKIYSEKRTRIDRLCELVEREISKLKMRAIRILASNPYLIDRLSMERELKNNPSAVIRTPDKCFLNSFEREITELRVQVNITVSVLTKRQLQETISHECLVVFLRVDVVSIGKRYALQFQHTDSNQKKEDRILEQDEFLKLDFSKVRLLVVCGLNVTRLNLLKQRKQTSPGYQILINFLDEGEENKFKRIIIQNTYYERFLNHFLKEFLNPGIQSNDIVQRIEQSKIAAHHSCLCQMSSLTPKDTVIKKSVVVELALPESSVQETISLRLQRGTVEFRGGLRLEPEDLDFVTVGNCSLMDNLIRTVCKDSCLIAIHQLKPIIVEQMCKEVYYRLKRISPVNNVRYFCNMSQMRKYLQTSKDNLQDGRWIFVCYIEAQRNSLKEAQQLVAKRFQQDLQQMRKLHKSHKVTFIIGVSSGNFKAKRLDKDFTCWEATCDINEFEYLMKFRHFRQNNTWPQIKDNRLLRTCFDSSDPVMKFERDTRNSYRSCLTLNQTTSYNHG